jgi:hypothetical protein
VKRDEELLKIVRDYAEQIARVEYSGDFHARYSHESQDDIAEGIRTFWEEAGSLFAAAK